MGDGEAVGYRVKIRGTDKTVEVGDDETILEAALSAGIDYPFGCQSGNCGACKTRLLAGEVEMSDYSEYALTDDERAQGQILACSAVPVANCDVAWLDLEDTVQHAMQALDCTVAAVERATHDIVILRLQAADGGTLAFSAGQYASLGLAKQPPRDFSMASEPYSGILEFHIRAIADGQVSQFAQSHVQVGDAVALSGPMGLAFLRELHTGPIVAVAGGSGLAPIKSIVETALAKGMAQPITLYFGARAERDLYLVAHFEALAAKYANFSFIPVLSEETGATTRRTGMLADAIGEDLATMDGCKIYAAGPPPLVDAVRALADRLGARPEDLHADPFYTVHELAAQK
ncbi:MAG: 2Fe-2S iron-sulfur cluster-binding protein [Proteobacteria bacterium]|nr:2Fe-2S iron-sulfur cluster-binding protein [Pseudomonadota bacterium]